MLDTLIYVPTILAYVFLSLLISILGFIVIYVSHKVYLIVYENVPTLEGDHDHEVKMHHHHHHSAQH